jgi:hypothetical protein
MLAWTSHERQKLLSAESCIRFEAARQKTKMFDDAKELRGALLDFIADFANWDNSTLWPQNSVAPLMHKDLQQMRDSILDHFVLSGTSVALFGFQDFAVVNPCRCPS